MRGFGRVGRSVLTLVGVVLLAALVAAFVPISQYAITPGSAQDVRPLIRVPTARAGHEQGAVLLTDVDLVALHALDYLYYRFDHNAEIVPAAQLTGPFSAAQYNEAGVIDMLTARQAATVVGLRALGYAVHAQPSAVIVYAYDPSGPNAAHVSVGEVVDSLNGQRVKSLVALKQALARLHPGARITIRSHVLGTSTEKTTSLTLGVANPRATSVVSSCLPASAHLPAGAQSCIGIEPVQLYRTIGAPFSITIDAEGIVGPSAGLAFALGLVAKLDSSSLTAGHTVAATGTISLDGRVGDVGGVAQKTIAARDAGASVFFVPPPELSVARAHAGAKLKVIAVASFSEALAALKAMGGRLTLPAKGTP